MNPDLTFASSVPGESPPPLSRSTHGTVSEIRNDVMKTRAIVSEFEHNLTNTHTMVFEIHRTIVQDQRGGGSKHLSVSDDRTLAVIECPLTAAQTQTRSAT